MRYRYYKCETHGRLEEEGYKVIRKGIDKIVHCNKCGEIATIQFIIICKHHGELSSDMVKPAKKGHGTCRLCHRQTAGQSRNSDRAAFNAKQTLDREVNPDKWNKIYKKAYQNKREEHGELLSLIKVCEKRKITLEQYFGMVESQDNKCAICGLKESCIDGRSADKKPRRLSVDHCHRTGNVRGLLCHACNTAIGKFKDDIELLQKAIKYITKPH